MSVTARIRRHTRISSRVQNRDKRATPPFMIVFINSICNLTCEHCFYWQNLNRRDDLTYQEFDKLSRELRFDPQLTRQISDTAPLSGVSLGFLEKTV